MNATSFSRGSVKAGTNGVMHAECMTAMTGSPVRGRPWISTYGSACSFTDCNLGGFIAAGSRIARRVPESERRTSSGRSSTVVDLDSNERTSESARLAAVFDARSDRADKAETSAFASSLAPAGTDAAGNVVVQALAAMLLPQIKSQIDAKLDAISPEALRENASKTINAAIEGKVSMYDSLVGDLLVAAEKRIAELSMPRQIEVKRWDGTSTNVGVQHKQFPLLLATLSARVPCLLVGPSGSGKTTACEKAAKALGLNYYYTGAITDVFSLLGYNDAHGKYVRTPFRDAVEFGGVMLLDEVDASDANALLGLNAALANSHVAFPDKVIERHPDCVFVASANTYGNGATHEYVGRNKLDTAFLKRFANLEWNYDDDLEIAMSGNAEWAKRVQAVRANVKSRGLRIMITPRETVIGARLLAQGIPQETVEVMTLRSGASADQWELISR